MNANFKNRSLPYSNPFANALVVVVGMVAIAVFFVIGLVAFFALAAAIVVLASVIGIRVWWLGRHTRNAPGHAYTVNNSRSSASQVSTIIEGECQVIPGDKGDSESAET